LTHVRPLCGRRKGSVNKRKETNNDCLLRREGKKHKHKGDLVMGDGASRKAADEKRDVSLCKDKTVKRL
jgi:hypothetical protein